jgi:hypothetical protein
LYANGLPSRKNLTLLNECRRKPQLTISQLILDVIESFIIGIEALNPILEYKCLFNIFKNICHD